MQSRVYLEPPGQREDQDDEQNQSDPAAGIVAPASAVGPGWECSD